MTVLSGKTAVVTGGARGAGRAIAEMLAAEGANVVIADSGTSRSGDGRDPTIAQDAAKALGNRAIAFGESVASPGVAHQLVELAVRAFGGIDILVNAAIIRRDGLLIELEPGDFEAVVRNNLCAPFHLTRAAAAAMLKRGTGGRIVHMIEPAEPAGQAAGAIIQPAIVALSATASLQLARYGIEVSVASSSEEALRFCTP